ncbi:hypothetical protein CDAR_413361 [Caerostris darwini]|uniref:Uncharacterized protein n=1 Tax=Caerostris darwini TaxID=1538125 RepID=A0AAV4T5F4_9ARAC|nr:hypothetical protein CDAR_413361 [Caerostris darwini]
MSQTLSVILEDTDPLHLHVICYESPDSLAIIPIDIKIDTENKNEQSLQRHTLATLLNEFSGEYFLINQLDDPLIERRTPTFQFFSC